MLDPRHTNSCDEKQLEPKQFLFNEKDSRRDNTPPPSSMSPPSRPPLKESLMDNVIKFVQCFVGVHSPFWLTLGNFLFSFYVYYFQHTAGVSVKHTSANTGGIRQIPRDSRYRGPHFLSAKTHRLGFINKAVCSSESHMLPQWKHRRQAYWVVLCVAGLTLTHSRLPGPVLVLMICTPFLVDQKGCYIGCLRHFN